MALFPLTTLAVLVAVIVFFVLGANVGKARAKYGVPAPAMSGHPDFDRRNRVQMNTLEQLVIFLPAIYLAVPVLGDAVTAAIGLLWSVGRIVYARAYYADAAKRGPGFAITMLSTLALIIAAAYGAIRLLLV
jgi:glutathione S-transferase